VPVFVVDPLHQPPQPRVVSLKPSSASYGAFVLDTELALVLLVLAALHVLERHRPVLQQLFHRPLSLAQLLERPRVPSPSSVASVQSPLSATPVQFREQQPVREGSFPPPVEVHPAQAMRRTGHLRGVRFTGVKITPIVMWRAQWRVPQNEGECWMQNEFGKLMRKHRRAAEKTFADVATALECSVGYVADVESGRRAPLGDEKFELFAHVIAVPLKDLKRAAVLCRGAYTLTVSKNASPKAFEAGAALARDFGNLDDDALSEILRVVLTAHK